MLEAVWAWREQEAQRQDRPPFKIISNPAVIEVALAQPKNLGDLGKIPSLSESEIDRYGKELLQAVQEGRGRPPLAPPERSSRPDEWLEKHVLDRYDALRRWRAKVADSRGVTPDIVLTNEVLLEIAKQPPRTLDDLRKFDVIGPWKAKTYGPDILRIASK
jgi:ribonuclease D